jgi:predicted nucleic acid-binding protein
VRGYLLDVNHVGPFIRKEPGIMAKARATPADHLIWICNITVGEIEAGNRGMSQTTDQRKRDEFIRLVNEKFESFKLVISEHTPACYGEIMGRIWQADPPHPRIKTEQHLLNLGVDINDVWAVAVAWEHGLTFLTDDKMACIRKAVEEDVEFDCWTQQQS